MADGELLSQRPPAQVGTEADLYLVEQAVQGRKQTRTQLRTAILSAWQTFIRTFLASTTTAGARTAIGAAGSGANTDITSITGSAASLTTSRSISATGDATWSVSFNGTANAAAALTLAASGVGAGTYGAVTVNAKGLVTAGTALGANVATFLATPTSANLISAVTDETGSGSLVFGTTPTLNKPNVVGTATNDNAAAGSVGEFVSSTVLAASSVALTSGVAADITSISLTAGDWEVWGNVVSNPGAGTTTSVINGAANSVSATLPTFPGAGGYARYSYSSSANAVNSLPIGRVRFSLSATTTIYLVTNMTFAVSTMSAYGFIGARRIR